MLLQSPFCVNIGNAQIFPLCTTLVHAKRLLVCSEAVYTRKSLHIALFIQSDDCTYWEHQVTFTPISGFLVHMVAKSEMG